MWGDIFSLWVFLSALVGVAWVFVLVPLSYFALTRPFDKFLPRGVGPEYDFWFASWLIFRPGSFAFHIVFPGYASRNPIANLNWCGFSFRENASRWQIIFSYVYIYSLGYSLAFGVLAMAFGVI